LELNSLIPKLLCPPLEKHVNTRRIRAEALLRELDGSALLAFDGSLTGLPERARMGAVLWVMRNRNSPHIGAPFYNLELANL
jgi:hypothetical protein